MAKKNNLLRKLERDIVEQNRPDGRDEAYFEDEERKVIEDRRQSSEGLGIEEEEDAGQEPYPEIEKALRDPEEEEDEDRLD